MPSQAFALKKYRRSIGPASKICDSEHATAPLRHSEMLRVQYAPFEHSIVANRCAFRAPAVRGDCNVSESCHFTNH
jgi:hypothetical protein